MSERPPLTDDEISAEIDELGRRNAEAIRRASRAPHPWDEWDVNGSGPPPIAAELERRRASLTVQDIRRLGVPPSVHSDYELGAAILWDRSTDTGHNWDLLWYDRRVLINVIAWLAGDREAEQ